MASVKISRRGAKRIRNGHLWVYRSDVREADDAAAGQIVRVVDEAGNAVGQAFYSDRSEIALRFLSRRARKQSIVNGGARVCAKAPPAARQSPRKQTLTGSFIPKAICCLR